MASPEDHKHIATVLIPELLEMFNQWAQEYQQPRDLGLRGEFVGLYRKTRKLKTLFWDQRDGAPPPENAGWREGPRTIIQEVVAHGLLMLCDWDAAHPEEVPFILGQEGKSDQDDEEREEDEEEYCPTCASHMKATRLVIAHGTKCGDEWHQVDVADRLGGV